MKKFFACIFALIIITSLGITAIAASNDTIDARLCDVNIETETPAILTNVGTCSVKNAISINGTVYNLFTTFDDLTESIENVTREAENIILHLQSSYDLEDFSCDTWRTYYDAMYMMFEEENCPDWYTESNVEFRVLRAFFDIMKGSDSNSRIIEKLDEISDESYSMFSSNDQEEALNNIMLDLPYSSLSDEEISELYNGLVASTTAYSSSAAITYALKYAEEANSLELYPYFPGSDCTNFASQILEAGGLSQTNTGYVSTGWWHVADVMGTYTEHTYSNSWTVANTFASYFGVKYSTTSNATFSANISAGSFIGADYTNNGSWDHIGFVTAVSSSKTNGYYDYRVAQHSSDYLEWTSSSANGWEEIGSDGGKYARIRT